MMQLTQANGKKPRRNALERDERRLRILAGAEAGRSYAGIGRSEGLSGERVRQIVHRAIDEDPTEVKLHHARLQLLRLGPALRLLHGKIMLGDVKAVPIYLKVLERLDKSHALAAAHAPADGVTWRQRFGAKIDAFAARREDEKARIKSEEEIAAEARIRALNEAERRRWQIGETAAAAGMALEIKGETADVARQSQGFCCDSQILPD